MLSYVRQPCDEAVVSAQPDVPYCGQSTGRWVLSAAILGSSITFIDGTVVTVVLPVLQSELGASVTQTQWIVESYALMLAALMLVGGALGDRLGRKGVFMTGVVLFALASIWCGLAPNLTQLIVARAVQGVGAALLVPGSLALISANFSKATRGRAIGTWSGFTAIGAGFGPILGGWLVERFSWRWIFFINVPLAIAVLFIAWRHIPESRNEQARGRMDWLGAGLATVGLGSIVFSLIESNTRGLSDPLVIASFTLGVVALAGFVFSEAHQEEPMMPLAFFRSSTFAGANLLTLFLYAALGGLLFFLPFNLIQVQGYRPTAAAAALLPFVLTMFLLSRWAGGLVARYGSKLPLTVGPVITAAGYLMFVLPGGASGNYWTNFFPAVLLMSIGMSISVAPLTTTVLGAIDVQHAGIASGINNVISRTGSLLAVAAFGVIMLNAFNNGLAERLRALPVSTEVRAHLVRERGALANLKAPAGLSSEMQSAIRQAVRDSFIAGFRLVAFIAALLALASALASWLLIEGKPHREEQEQEQEQGKGKGKGKKRGA